MANPHKGEMAFSVGDKSYALRFSADAICNLEDKLGKTMSEFGDLFADPKSLRLSTVRTMFVFALRDVHPEIDEDGARDIFKQLMPPEAMHIVVSAFNRSFGGDEGGEGSENPQQPGGAVALNGTGMASGSHGVRTD